MFEELNQINEQKPVEEGLRTSEKWWQDLEMNTLTPQEATEILRGIGVKISVAVLRDGIEAGAYPFGMSYKTKNGGIKVFIFEEQFKRWVFERSKVIDGTH